jgi:hypothetical protein
VATAAALWACFRNQGAVILNLGAVGVILAALLGLSILGKFTSRASSAGELASRFVLGVVLGTLGYVAARLHLWLFDPLYLSRGSLKQTLPEKAVQTRSAYPAQ